MQGLLFWEYSQRRCLLPLVGFVGPPLAGALGAMQPRTLSPNTLASRSNAAVSQPPARAWDEDPGGWWPACLDISWSGVAVATVETTVAPPADRVLRGWSCRRVSGGMSRWWVVMSVHVGAGYITPNLSSDASRWPRGRTPAFSSGQRRMVTIGVNQSPTSPYPEAVPGSRWKVSSWPGWVLPLSTQHCRLRCECWSRDPASHAALSRGRWGAAANSSQLACCHVLRQCRGRGGGLLHGRGVSGPSLDSAPPVSDASSGLVVHRLARPQPPPSANRPSSRRRLYPTSRESFHRADGHVGDPPLKQPPPLLLVTSPRSCRRGRQQSPHSSVQHSDSADGRVAVTVVG